MRSDNQAFFKFLAEQPQVSGRLVGTTGYCLGGSPSLIAAAQFPDVWSLPPRITAATWLPTGSH